MCSHNKESVSNTIECDDNQPVASTSSPQTALDELLSRIAKLRRTQSTFEDSFELIHSQEKKWCKLFAEFISDDAFYNPEGNSSHTDDMLWYVPFQKINQDFYIDNSANQLRVCRRQSPNKPPLYDPSINWEETLCLNLILQQFDFLVTCAVCTKTSPQNLQILRKNYQRVYPSPSRRQMDSKGDCEEITYPKLYFAIDDFEQVFNDLIVRDGECVCVELVASDRGKKNEAVVFLGSIRYEVLKQVYDARASLSWQWAQKLVSSSQRRREFVRMRGPHGKGYAEMAVMRVPNCGYETPVTDQCVGFDELNQCNLRRLSDTNLSRYPQRLPLSHMTSDVSKNRSRRCQSENDSLNQYPEVEASTIDDEFNEGVLSRLWSVRGFGQAWHWLREKRRAESTPLNAFLTYVTLPWSTILDDLLLRRPRRPILTFGLNNLELKTD